MNPSPDASLTPATASRRATFLPFAPPSIGEEEIAEVVDALRSGWITTGPKTRQFEREFAAYLGSPDALAVNSCTAAMHTALLALGVGPGDEVITTPLTFAASVNVIEHVGARPVLVDVEPETLTLDAARVAGAVTRHTRVILPVHYAGHPAELDALEEIALARRLHVLEDAAHALPARYRGRLIGSGANPVAFSFYATKNLTTGEGGMLTGDPDLLSRARTVSLHGMSHDAWRRYEKGGSWRYDIVQPGFKYNMSDVAAAMGLQQLRKLEALQARRRAIVGRYTEGLGDLDALELPVARPHVDHAWHLYVLRLRPGVLRIDRDRFIAELTARNIGTSVHFIPIHLHPYYRDRYDYRPEDFPVAYQGYRRMLSLPLSPRFGDRDVEDVITAVRDIVQEFRR